MKYHYLLNGLLTLLLAAAMIASGTAINRQPQALLMNSFRDIMENAHHAKRHYIPEFTGKSRESSFMLLREIETNDSLTIRKFAALPDDELFVASIKLIAERSYGFPFFSKNERGEIEITFTIIAAENFTVTVICVRDDAALVFRDVMGWERLIATHPDALKEFFEE